MVEKSDDVIDLMTSYNIFIGFSIVFFCWSACMCVILKQIISVLSYKCLDFNCLDLIYNFIIKTH